MTHVFSRYCYLFPRLTLHIVLPVQVRQGTQPGEKVVLRGKGWSLWSPKRLKQHLYLNHTVNTFSLLFFCRNKGEKFVILRESLCPFQHQSPNVCFIASTKFQFRKRKEKQKKKHSIGVLFSVCFCRELTPRQRELMEEFDKEESNDGVRVAAASG
jgi:DnaJ-class molecular chaperone